MIVRPHGIVIEGELRLGLELVVDGKESHIQPHTGIPEPFILSPAFVNAHSHLEYRGLQGKISETAYWPWIRAITSLKPTQDLEQVRADTILAAQENVAAGVGYIMEHSDRPFAAEAMLRAGLDGVIYQELITLAENDDVSAKVQTVRERATTQAQTLGGLVHVAPHATYTVSRYALAELGSSGEPVSIHVSETEYENKFFREGTGPIGEFYERLGIPHPGRFRSAVAYLHELGLVRSGAQFVHCCAVDSEDIALMAAGGVTVAHCPRSNRNLGCPISPIPEFLKAGVQIGLGLDSPASSGPIDMFAEMREALRSNPCLSAEQVWKMATAGSLETKWIKIESADATCTEDLLAQPTPPISHLAQSQANAPAVTRA